MNSSIRDQILAKYKEEYISLLKSTEREGIDSLISWLSTETDFFTAPASTNKHGSYEGGLVRHSLSVYRILSNFSKNIPEARKDSIILIALLHDLCKVNFYIRTFRNVKNESGKWERVEIYGIDDTLPLGHGEKSLYLAMRHIQLTEEEAAGIRWHMGGYDDASRAYVSGIAQAQAFNKYPLAAAVAIADMYDTYIVDRKSD